MPIKNNEKNNEGKRILVVEDDPFLSDIYNTKLKQGGFDVDSAMTGEECLQKLNSKNYDLMLLDIVLPQLDGWEVMARVREMRQKNPDSDLNRLKIIILSNLGQKEEIKKGLELGADGFMIKAHFTPSEIAEEINKTLNIK
ncbi:MAG: response regulator [Candidatus Nealsonbacteria bacterium DGGOD1a]|jgi:DNA-binding response OmpR family regulator|nr:MAG: response regulator [Candidatus Nealsonbacteria bacterium DGGOD1a]